MSRERTNPDGVRLVDATVDRTRIASSRGCAGIPAMDVWVPRRSRTGRPEMDYWMALTVERLPDGSPGRAFHANGSGVGLDRVMPARRCRWRQDEPTAAPAEADFVGPAGEDPMEAREVRVLMPFGGGTCLVQWSGDGLSGMVSIFALDVAAGEAMACRAGPTRPGHPARAAAAAALPEPARSCVGRWLVEPEGHSRWPFCLEWAEALGWRAEGRTPR